MPGRTKRNPSSRRARSRRSIAAVLAWTPIVFAATTAEIAQQDITALIEASRDNVPRWMTAVVAAEHGSAHAPSLVLADASNDSRNAPDFAVTNAAQGDDGTVVRGLEKFAIEAQPDKLPEKIEINRSSKGDRYLSMAPDREMLDLAAGSVYSVPNMIAAGPSHDLPRVAFVAPLPDTVLGPGPAIASAKKSGDPLDLTRLAIARNVAATSVSLASAYAANPMNDTAAPFRALLGTPDLDAQAETDPHWWTQRALPASVLSAKEQRCLAEAVYFEARGEPEDGQVAVAQVVLNRVKNPTYPDTICKVVYQNRHKRNRCQFSFACDGKRDRISSKDSWETAQRIARETVEGEQYLKEVGASTHYHATYVHPGWARTMDRLEKIGRHIFYRTKGGGWS
ncbi:cell wall hydrolase [Rhizobiales bacterium]|uniref:cell wall hydrolase n=1 Tax=Hongsoonwoonella zoysiae TaxID=2821844 RepID=UPI0015619D52|nr:cell wall hydrolase [Hongsoonwoonella zoysiae]NRG19737.1 cell wall hydrolase [Hongsoonwoonella zoysiae]